MPPKPDTETLPLEEGPLPQVLEHSDDRTREAQGRDFSSVPKSYWISPSFIGTYSAMGLTFAGTVGGFALAAPVMSDINQDLGPSPNIVVRNRSLTGAAGPFLEPELNLPSMPHS